MYACAVQMVIRRSQDRSRTGRRMMAKRGLPPATRAPVGFHASVLASRQRWNPTLNPITRRPLQRPFVTAKRCRLPQQQPGTWPLLSWDSEQPWFVSNNLYGQDRSLCQMERWRRFSISHNTFAHAQGFWAPFWSRTGVCCLAVQACLVASWKNVRCPSVALPTHNCINARR